MSTRCSALRWEGVVPPVDTSLVPLWMVRSAEQKGQVLHLQWLAWESAEKMGDGCCGHKNGSWSCEEKDLFKMGKMEQISRILTLSCSQYKVEMKETNLCPYVSIHNGT